MQNSKPITPDQRDRWDRLRIHGCICCKKSGRIRAPEIHHLVEGMKRLGHDFTIPLCPWHHRAEPPFMEMRKSEALEWLGPSLAESKRQFTEYYGTERELLEEVNLWLDQRAAEEGGPKAKQVNGSSFAC